MDIHQTVPGPRHRLPFYPGHFLVAMATVSLGPLLDPMMQDLSIPLSQGGLINGILFVGSALGIVLFNVAQSHLVAKWWFAGSTAFLALGLILAGTAAHSLWAVCLAYSAVGLSIAVMLAVSFMWLAVHLREKMATSALVLTIFFGMAMISVPVIIGQALERGWTWRHVLMVEGGVALVAALAFALMPLLDIPGRQNVRLTHLREAASHNRGLLLAILGAGFTYTGAEFVLNVWLPKFQIEVFSSSDAFASLAVTLFWTGEVTGRLFFVPLARRVEPARLLLVCTCVMAVFTTSMSFASSATSAVVLAALAGLAASPCYALIASYSGAFPGWKSGVVSSLFVLSGAPGGMLFPYLIGPLADSAGFRIALAAVAVPILASGAFALLLHARSRDHASVH